MKKKNSSLIIIYAIINRMINKPRSRSFSFKNYRQKIGGALHSPFGSTIFKPTKKINPFPSSQHKTPLLGVSYASPIHECIKERKLIIIDSKLIPERNSIQMRLSNSNIHKKSDQLEGIRAEYNHKCEIQQIKPSVSQQLEKKSCMYKYFTSLWKKQWIGNVIRKKSIDLQQSQTKPWRSKSILVIRKRAKRKQEAAQNVKDKLQEQFRNNKQIPIHHTQFYFSKKSSSKTQNSPSAKQSRSQEFTQKIHRAVEEIMRLRASLSGQKKDNQLSHSFDGQTYNSPIHITGEGKGSFIKFGEERQFKTKKKTSISKIRVKIGKQALFETLHKDQAQIGPWKKGVNHDFQTLF